ncbi:serine hydrolase domain-containing protein [Nocardia niigatensis]|uniref:serine hydrolase domain-containing protein n=1 Tax=Nocardia niigatensis TaxID=209249 RepID=UPI000319C6F8|nr:serine hydrolase domain-containing protein [Nocardia niigatensis]
MFVAAMGLAVAAGCGSSNDSGSKEPAYAETLRPLITQLMKDNVIPGAVVVVKSPKDGDWTATFGTGTIGKDDPMQVADHFRIGSNTKTMTVTVLMQLAQEGKLSLDDPIDKYWPGVPNGDRITLAQLAEMRSGLYNYTFDHDFSAAIDKDPQRVWKPEELLAIAFAHPVDFQPGEKFEYCNTNTILLGLVIEKVTNMPVAESFRQRIFEPLGLKNTSFPAVTDSSIPDPHPQGYTFGTMVSTIDTFELPPEQQAAAKAGTLLPNDQTTSSPSWAWTAGAAISTVDDMTTYTKALAEGKLLDAEFQKMRMDSIQPIDPDNPAMAGYGLGLVRFGEHQYGHDGQLPGFMTYMASDPDTGLTIVVATNLSAVPSGEGSALVLVKGMLPTFYGATAVPGHDPAQRNSGASTPAPSESTTGATPWTTPR